MRSWIIVPFYIFGGAISERPSIVGEQGSISSDVDFSRLATFVRNKESSSPQDLTLQTERERDREYLGRLAKDLVQREVASHLEFTLQNNCGKVTDRKIQELSGACLFHESRARKIMEKRAQTEQSLSVYLDFVHRTMPLVANWKVEAAPPGHTDRVATITIMEGGFNQYFQGNFKYVVQAVMKHLGPTWGLQVFYSPDSLADELKEELGHPQNVTWTGVKLNGRAPSKSTYNMFRWSSDFYSAIQAEHILIFELDSLLLRSNCIDGFLEWDSIGAPHSGDQFPPGFMNGGFTLRKRSTFFKAVQIPKDDLIAKAAGTRMNPSNEDSLVHFALESMNVSVPPLRTASQFALEQIPSLPTCGIHKPWLYETITPSFLEQALALMSDTA